MKVVRGAALLVAILAASHPAFALRQGGGRGVGISIKVEDGQLLRLYDRSYALPGNAYAYTNRAIAH